MQADWLSAKKMIAKITNGYLGKLFLLAAISTPVADGIRHGLQKDADQWFHWLVISSIAVAFGVAFEAPEATIALKRWYAAFRGRDNPPENERSLAIPASYLGLILVVLGVIGEGFFEAKLNIADTALHAYDSQKLALVTEEAGDASQSAARANQFAGVLEEEVRIQGPRWRLLEAHQREFVDALRPFSGQHFTILECGLTPSVEQERLEQDLLSFLGEHGAGWTPEVPGIGQWPKVAGIAQWSECAGGESYSGGNLITFSSRADKEVQHSAQRLADVLNQLKISTAAVPINPQWARYFQADSPDALTKDPTDVILLVGANPMSDLYGRKRYHHGKIQK